MDDWIMCCNFNIVNSPIAKQGGNLIGNNIANNIDNIFIDTTNECKLNDI